MNDHIRRLLLRAALPLVAVSCTGQDRTTMETVQHGDTIVVLGLSDTADYLRFSSVRDVRISDSLVIVADGASREIRLFTTDGRHLRTVSRRGSGPGEVESITSKGLLLDADTIWAFDFDRQLLTSWTTDGPHYRTIPAGAAFGRQVWIIGKLFDGSFLVRSNPMAGNDGSGEVPVAVQLARIVQPANEIQPLGTLDWGAMHYVVTGTGNVVGRTGYLLPFAAAPSLVTASDELAYWFASGQEAVVHKFTPGGDTITSVPLPIKQRAVEAGDQESFRSSMLAGVTSATGVQRINNLLAELKFPANFPAVSALWNEHGSGAIWVGEYLVPGDTVRVLHRVAEDGRALRRVVVPASWNIMSFAKDGLLSYVARDSLDVEMVVVARLSTASH